MEMRDPRTLSLKIKIKSENFFWRQCSKCKLEFRKTPMWSWNTYNWGDKVREYGCTNCFKDFDDLEEFLSPDIVEEKSEIKKIGFGKEL
jgi:hypothetical protein